MNDSETMQEFKRLAMGMLTNDEITDEDFDDLVGVFVAMATSCVYKGNLKGAIVLAGVATLVERERRRRDKGGLN